MKTILKYFAMIIVTLLLSYFCFVLPPGFSAYKDLKTVGQVNLETLEETNVVLKKQMTMLEKINLLKDQIDSNGIILKQGKELTVEKAKKACIEETVKLKELGIMGDSDFEVDFEKDYSSTQINFYISIADPSKSVILWNVIFIKDNKSVIISLDDETGKILGLVTSDEYTVFNADDGDGDYDQIIKGLGSYLGLEVSNIERFDAREKYDPIVYDKNIGLNVSFSDGGQQLDSTVYMFKTGFSMGIYNYRLFENVYKKLQR
jgi:hypothetical protein